MSFKRSSYVAVVACSLLPLAALFIGCRTPLLKSFRLDSYLQANHNPDWLNAPAYSLKQINGTVTLLNDDSTLYVRFVSRDKQLYRRLQGSGLTLWLSDENNTKHRLGIHYPIGMSGGTPPPRADRFLPNADLPPAAMFDMLSRQHDDIEILAEDSSLNGRRPLAEAEPLGVSVHLAESEGVVEYLLRLDLSQTLSGIMPEARLLLAGESPAMKRGRFERGKMGEHGGGPGGMPPDGGGGGMGGMGGKGGGHRPGGQPDRMEDSKSGISPNSAINFKVLVELATK